MLFGRVRYIVEYLVLGIEGTVKLVFKGPCDKGTPCDQGTLSHNSVLSSPC